MSDDPRAFDRLNFHPPTMRDVYGNNEPQIQTIENRVYELELRLEALGKFVEQTDHPDIKKPIPGFNT